jgi:hypothetical protein
VLASGRYRSRFCIDHPIPQLDEIAANDYNAGLSGKHLERHEMAQF